MDCRWKNLLFFSTTLSARRLLGNKPPSSPWSNAGIKKGTKYKLILQGKGKFWQHEAFYARKRLTRLSARDENANPQNAPCESNVAGLRIEIVDFGDLYS